MGVWLVLAAVAASVGAQPVPPLINYQGRLANADGTPFPTADYALRVAIYDAATAGTLVWGPQVFDGAPGTGHGPRLPVVQGYFNVMLGPVDTQGRSILEAFGGSNRFVEVTVSNRAPILPRQQILPAPFAVEAANGVPAGTIIAFGSPGVPPGWLPCDGRTVERDRYSRLWLAVGASWGPGNGSTTFHLPDLRGVFLRGVNGGRTDAMRDDTSERFSLFGGNSGSVGSYQMDAFKLHSHSFKRATGHTPNAGANAIFADNAIDIDGEHRGEINGEGNPNETRPKNAAVHYLIKY